MASEAVVLADTPRTRKLRQAVQDFVGQCRPLSRSSLLSRFRRFGYFLGLGKHEWSDGLIYLLSRTEEEAQGLGDRYSEWVSMLPSAGRELGSGRTGLLKFTHFARLRGYIDWEFKNRGMELSRRTWEACSPKFRKMLERWLRILEARQLSHSTVLTNREYLLQLGQVLARRRISIGRMREEDALSWIEGMRKAGLRASSINQKVHAARRFFAWMEHRRVIGISPLSDIGSIRSEKRIPRAVGRRQILALLRNAKNPTDRAILETLYATGCRIAELRSLNVDDVEPETRTIRCLGKGRVERDLYLNHAAVRALLAYLPIRSRMLRRSCCDFEPALFVSKRGTRMSLNRIRDRIRAAARGVEGGTPITAHIIRHSFATHLLDNDIDLFCLSQLMGHSSLQSTQVYLKSATARVRKMYERCHPRK